MKSHVLTLVAALPLLAGSIGAPALASRAEPPGASTARVQAGSARPVTVGTVLTAPRAGRITAVRFHKSRLNVGRHVAAVFAKDGRRLARATFRNESRTGWQRVRLSSPVRLRAGQTVTVAVFMPRGHASVDRDASWPRRGGGLVHRKGVFRYAEQLRRPMRSARGHDYGVRAVFARGAATAAPTPGPSTGPASGPTAGPGGWPDASNTGVTGCGPLQQVDNGDEVRLARDGQVLENKEFLNPAVIRVVAHNVTIRCVKLNGTGWYGIDNTDLTAPADHANDTIVDRVEISCQDQGQVIGMLLQSATVTRSNVYACDHFLNAGGDNLVIRDNYCHDLTDKPVVHADCIQTMGGNRNMLIEHNSLWSRDTSDILLGQEYGDATNVVINNNRLMSVGSPPPAYLLYLSGTNTVVTNNRFTRRFTYGHCTLNTRHPVVWEGNVWDDNGAPIRHC